jgi:selenide,water dikinase
VYRLSDEQAVVLTVDVITPVVDEAYLFGQVAASNSISDVYAMGGRPIMALNVCCFPCEVPAEALNQILLGGQATARACGCPIVGGHTVKDNELKYGLAVLGLVHPERVKRNSTARVGDQLILTKPLGTGVLISSAKSDRVSPERLHATCHAMARTNREAMEVAQAFDTSALTDVTGFGLGGHLAEMARGAGVGLRVEAGRLPAYPDVLALFRSGAGTGAAKANAAVIEPLLVIEGDVAPEHMALLTDPQTAGGLVMAVCPTVVDAALEALHDRGVHDAVRIGEVVDSGGAPALTIIF